MGKTSISKIIRVRRVKAPLATRTPASISSDMRAKQAAKIQEIRQVLVNAGFSVLDQQAVALGLSRSTAWAVLKGKHKGSGLSATLINRMLTSPKLPPSARAVLIEYVEEKSAGAYGHSKDRLRIFRAQVGELIVGTHGQRDMPVWGDRYRVRTEANEPISAIDRRARAQILALVEYLRRIQEK